MNFIIFMFFKKNYSINELIRCNYFIYFIYTIVFSYLWLVVEALFQMLFRQRKKKNSSVELFF